MYIIRTFNNYKTIIYYIWKQLDVFYSSFVQVFQWKRKTLRRLKVFFTDDVRTFSRDNVLRWFLFSLSSTRIKFILEKSTARHANLQAVNSREYARLLLQFSVVTKSQENIAVAAKLATNYFSARARYT